MSRVKTKKQAQAAHAKRRLRERHGIHLNREGLREIVAKIKRGDGMFLEKKSLRVSMWAVEVCGKRVRCLYDKNRKMVVTVLPEDDNAIT